MSAPDPDDLLEQAMRYAEQRETRSEFDIEQGLERLAREVRRFTPAADAAHTAGRARGGKTVVARDGRTLMFESWGAPKGTPVFLMHGTPGSRKGPHPRSSVLYRLGIRLIAYDRPGYGGSDPLRGRTVAHAAADVEAIADHLGLNRFAIVGRFGGAPHALACAALLPERVTRAAALVSLAPRDAGDLDWYAGMTPSKVHEYRSAEMGYQVLADRISAYGDRIHNDPFSALPFDAANLPAHDRKVVSDAGIRSMMVDTFTEALNGSYTGWIDDTFSFTAPWGFQVEEITSPTLLWHGELDVFSPVAHARWLANHIPNALLTLDGNSAHIGAVAVLPRVLNWLLEDPRERVQWRTRHA